MVLYKFHEISFTIFFYGRANIFLKTRVRFKTGSFDLPFFTGKLRISEKKNFKSVNSVFKTSKLLFSSSKTVRINAWFVGNFSFWIKVELFFGCVISKIFSAFYKIIHIQFVMLIFLNSSFLNSYHLPVTMLTCRRFPWSRAWHKQSSAMTRVRNKTISRCLLTASSYVHGCQFYISNRLQVLLLFVAIIFVANKARWFNVKLFYLSEVMSPIWSRDFLARDDVADNCSFCLKTNLGLTQPLLNGYLQLEVLIAQYVPGQIFFSTTVGQ